MEWKAYEKWGEEEFIPRHNIEFITKLAKSASHPAYSIAGNNDGTRRGGGGGERWLD